jgi:hypothetical protein
MKNESFTRQIIEQLFGLFDRKMILCVVHYGNRNGRDIDLFVVSASEKFYSRKVIGQLDVTIIAKDQLHHLINCLNPLVTEPLLTGQVIWGDPLLYEKEMLNSITAGPSVVTHLLESSFRIFKEAESSLDEKNVNDALINLSFSISFFYFSVYYKNSHKIITFKQLLTEYPNSILSMSYSALKGGTLELKDVNSMVEKTKGLFKKQGRGFSSPSC